MMAWLRSGTVQAIRMKKHAATAIKYPSILLTQNIIKWSRRQLVFRVPGIHSPVPIQATSAQTPNTLSAVELNQIATVVIQAQSMTAATATVAPTIAPFTFDGRFFFRMLGWCGLNTKQERRIPSMWKQLKLETTNTGKKSFFAHLLNPSNVVDEEVNIFLRKQLVTDVTTQNFGFRYTTAYGASHH